MTFNLPISTAINNNSLVYGMAFVSHQAQYYLRFVRRINVFCASRSREWPNHGTVWLWTENHLDGMPIRYYCLIKKEANKKKITNRPRVSTDCHSIFAVLFELYNWRMNNERQRQRTYIGIIKWKKMLRVDSLNGAHFTAQVGLEVNLTDEDLFFYTYAFEQAQIKFRLYSFYL